jgi:hypothetical protein
LTKRPWFCQSDGQQRFKKKPGTELAELDQHLGMGVTGNPEVVLFASKIYGGAAAKF